jgi:quercetin dioxygenase-like cupin family protein
VARVFTLADAKRLDLPGRTSREILSARVGAANASLRLVEIDPPSPDAGKRGPHVHRGLEEVIHVLSGAGVMESEGGEHPVKPGDTILVPAGELHVTHNVGDDRLVLLCFFPAGDAASVTQEFSSWATARSEAR